MNKKETLIVEQFYKDYHIDPRTMGMIVHHYIDIGERAAASITQDQVDRIYKEKKVEEAELEKNNQFLFMSPEFVAYLLTACSGLAKMDPNVRYKLIKETL